MSTDYSSFFLQSSVEQIGDSNRNQKGEKGKKK